jgi:hypothetical protein
VKRADYLAEVIRLYLGAPDTPRKARRRDWAIAGTLYRLGIPLQTVAHSIRMAALRRHLRDPELGPLEPIYSLAYYRTVIDQLDPLALDPSFVKYIAWKYDIYFSNQVQKRG